MGIFCLSLKYYVGVSVVLVLPSFSPFAVFFVCVLLFCFMALVYIGTHYIFQDLNVSKISSACRCVFVYLLQYIFLVPVISFYIRY